MKLMPFVSLLVCFLIAGVTAKDPKTDHEIKTGLYFIRNLYGCKGQPGSKFYASKCGNYAVQLPSNKVVSLTPTKRPSLLAAWAISPVQGQKDVYIIQSVGCEMVSDDGCGYWSFFDPNLRWVIADRKKENAVKWEITPRGPEGGYRIRTKNNCDKEGRPWPCDVEVTWETFVRSDLWLNNGFNVNFEFVPVTAENFTRDSNDQSFRYTFGIGR